MTHRDSFERAFVAASYLLGRRADLCAGLVAPSEEAVALSHALGAPDRNSRAETLARALRPLVEAFEARKVR